MGKQTRKSGSKFGGEWTRKKLLIIEEYLKQYSKVLKNTRVKKIYIDAFAGSGKTIIDDLKNEPELISLFDQYPEIDTIVKDSNSTNILDGSAILSLKYDFDEYYFMEIDNDRLLTLKQSINQLYPEKINKVHLINGNSNDILKEILKKIMVKDRCLMFLDPYSLELDWNVIEEISKCGVIDLWYLFPLNAISRIIPKDRKKLNNNEKLITKILGTNEWERTLYEVDNQTNFFNDEIKKRVEFNKLIEFIKNRFKELFPYVFDKEIILKNTAKSSPLFLLCFMMTNNSENAINLADRLVNGIKEKVEK